MRTPLLFPPPKPQHCNSLGAGGLGLGQLGSALPPSLLLCGGLLYQACIGLPAWGHSHALTRASDAPPKLSSVPCPPSTHATTPAHPEASPHGSISLLRSSRSLTAGQLLFLKRASG